MKNGKTYTESLYYRGGNRGKGRNMAEVKEWLVKGEPGHGTS